MAKLIGRVLAVLVVLWALLVIGLDSANAHAQPSFKLPWDAGLGGVGLTGGPHVSPFQVQCKRLPLPSLSGLDFGVSGIEVLSIADGTVVNYGKTSSGSYFVRIAHGGGWSLLGSSFFGSFCPGSRKR